MTGSFYGMLSAGMAYGIGEIFGHGRSFFQSRGDLGAASFKSLAHGVSRALIAKAQNQRAKAAFWSGFVTSGFSVGTKGYGGVTGRTLIMATVGGTVSSITGGKFANGAVSGAFIYMFNGMVGKIAQQIGKSSGKKIGEKLELNEPITNIFSSGTGGAFGGSVAGFVVFGPIGIIPGAILGFSGGLIMGTIMEASGINSFIENKISKFKKSIYEKEE